jgi:hypothetical protein
MKDKFLLFLFLKFKDKTFEIKNNNPKKFNFYKTDISQYSCINKKLFYSVYIGKPKINI